MNNEIKLQIEKYVMEGFNQINALDNTEDNYYSARSSIVKEINTFVELLQKEDINKENSKFNSEKIKNEITKIDKDHEINLKKLECEVKKNNDSKELEDKKIKNSFEIENKKIDNEITKINNDITKMDKDYEINNKKIECDKDKIKNEIVKIDKDYEINKEKIQMENVRHNDTLILENRKINVDEIKNNSDADLKKEELNIKSKVDIELRNDRIIKVVTETIKVVAPIITYNVWMKRGLIFEETGSFTSSIVKNLVNRIKPE